ncbi:MAG: ABC transporter substrate-binding protein [Rhodospirillaceae bacterium]|jgi:4,5-dihydroxyphthalate decarboxylase|nr:ABC transporter substrate-binding protein [Rhodospirillaceae bacterium]MBT5455278.1 ABC transporter substrate-binding protein [Rhodospirillaceae bacterium]
MTDLKLHMATGPYDRIEALRYGAIKPEGIALDYETRIPVHSIFVGMAEREEFDVSEMSLALYTTKRSRALAGGEAFPFVAIPVFPSRVFRHGNFFINRKTGIKSPKDLEGKRVGIQEYRQSAGVWMRGILRDEYGVDTDTIHWVEGGVDVPRKASASDVRPEREVTISELTDHDTLSAALSGGEIDAVMAARVPASSRVDDSIVRLFPDYRTVEQDWFQRTGIFPIMHTVVIREALYRDNPWMAQSLFAALEASKAKAQEQMRYTGAMMYMTPWMFDDIEEMDRVFGGDDPWLYGLEANRSHLETFMGHLVTEGFLPAPVALDKLFVGVS